MRWLQATAPGRLASADLVAWLNAQNDAALVSSALVEVEVPRALRRAAPQALVGVPAAIGRLFRLEIDSTIRATAAAFTEPTLRSLDAIHLATARFLPTSQARRSWLSSPTTGVCSTPPRQRDYPPQVLVRTESREAQDRDGSRNASSHVVNAQVQTVGRTMHHANHPAIVTGDPLPGRLTSSRGNRGPA